MTGAAARADAFLGGRLRIWQPVGGYRAGLDPVLLAAWVPARPGQSVLDLGCGVGTAALCLGARVPGLRLVGVEAQGPYADLARRNGTEAGLDFEVHLADIAALPAQVRQRRFDHVIANPPYFGAGDGTAASDPGREAALRETLPLAAWVATGARRLAPRGRMTVIQKAERLPDLLQAMTAHLGNLRLQPLAPREGRPAGLVLVAGVKGGRGPFSLLAPVHLHAGRRHETDAESYTDTVRAVLREAAALGNEDGK